MTAGVMGTGFDCRCYKGGVSVPVFHYLLGAPRPGMSMEAQSPLLPQTYLPFPF
jgi:hypothetical protein